MIEPKYTNAWGDFRLENAQMAPDIYFPLANEAHMISSVTPYLAGDAKVDQNTFLLAPASERSLVERTTGRNFWVRAAGCGPWSAAGCSARQLAWLHTPQEEACTLTGGLLWQQTERSWAETGLRAAVLSFVPADDVKAEVMQVTLTNTAQVPLELECVADIPIYGRSAEHLRDHRHVTSLLHRGHVTTYGLDVKPTLTFDERGHLPGRVVYRVWGADGQGMPPRYLVPVTRDFEGRGGPLWPDCVVKTPPEHLRRKEGDTAMGGELTAALYFAPCVLEPGQSTQFQLVLAVDSDPSPYLTPQGVGDALARTKAYWRGQSTCRVDTGDSDFSAWLRWVSIQPVLRRICGCSFLPHHDYGRGGRGWRDLWQDSLALLLSDPAEVRQDLLCHFGGVRPDGTNATIIGDRPGEFKADRNNIPRVWMDHGFWPFVTTKLYLEETGDMAFLLEQRPYFDDGFAYRGEGERPQTSLGRTGTVLEHLLVQQVTAFFDVGDHGIIRLRGADWNDGLDMAVQKGESVAFTAAYGGSLRDLAQAVRSLGQETVVLHRPLVQLMQRDFGAPETMRQALLDYCRAAYTDGAEETVPAETLAARLEAMSQWIFRKIRTQEQVGDGTGLTWFNSYYDNSGRQVEGVFGDQVRMMLTGQVFTIMSGAAEDEQVPRIARAVDWNLWESSRGGCFLNTDFGEVKTDLGRMFGFAYGAKENGAVFCHMAVMYAYALYSRGLAAEGLRVLDALYHQSRDFARGRILPGIPEYFDLQGRGMYPYLTGAASWFMLTLRQQMFGIRGAGGSLTLEPKLEPEQFDGDSCAAIQCPFGGEMLTVVYHNPRKLPYGSYRLGRVEAGGAVLTLPLTPAQLREAHGRLDVYLEQV